MSARFRTEFICRRNGSKDKRTYLGQAASITVAEVGRNVPTSLISVRTECVASGLAKSIRPQGVHLPLVTLNHQLHRLSPALDYLIRRKCGRRPSIITRIKLGPVNQRALVMARAWRANGGMALTYTHTLKRAR